MQPEQNPAAAARELNALNDGGNDMKSHSARSTRSHRAALFAMLGALLASAAGFAGDKQPLPVLMVIANQDFYWQEYGTTRASLEAQGLDVVVAAASTETAFPQGPQTWPTVQPDVSLFDISAANHSGVVFIGGWGSSMYQYDSPGTYVNAAYRPEARTARQVNRLIEDFVAGDKPVGGIGYGVSVLAWARVDGESLLRGAVVVGFAGGVPAFRLNGTEYPDAEVPMRWFIEQNGATMLTSRSIGDPMSSTDDVYIDGRIITAENYDSASLLAEVLAQVIAAQ